MKSTKEQLKSRGFAFDEDTVLYKNHGEKELVKLLWDEEAYRRTIAIKGLLKHKKEKYIKIFCEMLKTEKKLYTKIELCTALEKYSEKAIPYLIPLLGTIGNNHHKKPEIIDINKKSYPCPRDIAGRVLIRLGPKVFPALKRILLENKNIKQIPEAIDIIGHITWNYKDSEMEDTLIAYYRKNKGNEFLEWKIVRAFQAFVSLKIKALLENAIKTHKNTVIIKEAKRSLKRMESRMKG